MNIEIIACMLLAQLSCSDIMEQGEGDGDTPVESGGGVSDLAGCRAACGPRGAGLRHAGDAVPRQQTARVSAASRADHQLYEGKHLGMTNLCKLFSWTGWSLLLFHAHKLTYLIYIYMTTTLVVDDGLFSNLWCHLLIRSGDRSHWGSRTCPMTPWTCLGFGDDDDGDFIITLQ